VSVANHAKHDQPLPIDLVQGVIIDSVRYAHLGVGYAANRLLF